MGFVSFMSHFPGDQLCRTPAPCTRSFANETVVITGGNTGLGKEAARQIVALDAAKVIITSRDATKGEKAKRDIESATGRSGIVEVWNLDLASYASVQEFAARCQSLSRIDAVIMNAGVCTEKYTKAEDNETTITVNIISTFLLMLLLLPQLRSIAQNFDIHPRVCILSSDLHEVAPFKAQQSPPGMILNSMNDPATADMTNRYMDSKLLEILYLVPFFEAQKLKGSQGGVVTNIVNPGFCSSDLTREVTSTAFRAFEKVMARSTEEGARSHVFAAADGIESHRMYHTNGKARPLLKGTLPTTKTGKEVAKRFFDEVNQKLEKIVPGVTKNI